MGIVGDEGAAVVGVDMQRVGGTGGCGRKSWGGRQAELENE